MNNKQNLKEKIEDKILNGTKEMSVKKVVDGYFKSVVFFWKWFGIGLVIIIIILLIVKSIQ